MFPAISAIATLTRSGIADALASTDWIWLLFFTAVPALLVFLAERPTPTTRQVSSGGPPPQVLRDSGQPPRNHPASLWRRSGGDVGAALLGTHRHSVRLC